MDFYQKNILNEHIEEVENKWTGEKEKQVAYDNIYVAASGRYGDVPDQRSSSVRI